MSNQSVCIVFNFFYNLPFVFCLKMGPGENLLYESQLYLLNTFIFYTNLNSFSFWEVSHLVLFWNRDKKELQLDIIHYIIQT